MAALPKASMAGDNASRPLRSLFPEPASQLLRSGWRDSGVEKLRGLIGLNCSLINKNPLAIQGIDNGHSLRGVWTRFMESSRFVVPTFGVI